MSAPETMPAPMAATHFSQHRPVALLYVPASKPRAIAKAAGLAADAIILDLEDAVGPGDKDTARAAAAAAIASGQFSTDLLIVRINAAGTPWHADDIAALGARRPFALQLPKVEDAAAVEAVHAATGLPLLAMIETARGVLAARSIAAHPAVLALVAGGNDLALDLGVADAADRAAMSLSLQMMLLAARAEGKLAYDGVWSALDDAAGFAADCAAGRRLGLDGKTLIHPDQIGPCHAAWAPDAAALEDAEALIAAARTSADQGAVRFRGRMVEALHVVAAERLVARAAQLAGKDPMR